MRCKGYQHVRTITPALTLVLVSTVLLAACGDDEEDRTEDVEAAPTSITLALQDQGGGENLVAAGREVYLDVGCAQCHGDGAEVLINSAHGEPEHDED